MHAYPYDQGPSRINSGHTIAFLMYKHGAVGSRKLQIPLLESLLGKTLMKWLKDLNLKFSSEKSLS